MNNRRLARRHFAAFLSISLACTISANAAPAMSMDVSNAEFGGQCTEGLAEGQHVMTKCEVTWKDKDGKTYCFSSEASKASFLKNPQESLDRARSFAAASAVEETENAMQNFVNTDAEAVVQKHIDEVRGQNSGSFVVEDALTGDKLKLGFDGIDFTRTIDGYGFFPDVKFHDAADPAKKYLVDFWVVPNGKALKIAETRIYEAPMQVEGKWVMTARQPIPWWWIPASEHPGHMAEKRSWEVMSAVEADALKKSGPDGTFNLVDDKTGQTLALKFINAHQPIRKLDEDGHFFACTDFRVAGTTDQIYDIDFWVTEKDGKMSVDKTVVHKVPEKKNGQWVQIPRYEWKDLGNSHVVP